MLHVRFYHTRKTGQALQTEKSLTLSIALSRVLLSARAVASIHVKAVNQTSKLK